MNQSTSYLEPSARIHSFAAPPRRDRMRMIAFTVAILACLPYLALKLSWIAGGQIGIPSGSILLDPDNETIMQAANALTVLMDSAVIVLALLLTRVWGRRVPAWLLAGPTWIATGLLAPIVVGFPLQLVVTAFAGSGAAVEGSEPFLDPWVFMVVYGGFILQALALGTLFAMYACDRWGHLWEGTVAELGPTPGHPALRFSAMVAGVLAVIPFSMQVLWSLGSSAGLTEGMSEGRSRDALIGQAAHIPFGVLAVAGILMLAFGLGGQLPLWVPMALTWIGSSAMAGWGAWSLLTALATTDLTDRATPAMCGVWAVQVIVGMLIASAGIHFLAERSATRS